MNHRERCSSANVAIGAARYTRPPPCTADFPICCIAGFPTRRPGNCLPSCERKQSPLRPGWDQCAGASTRPGVRPSRPPPAVRQPSSHSTLASIRLSERPASGAANTPGSGAMIPSTPGRVSGRNRFERSSFRLGLDECSGASTRTSAPVSAATRRPTTLTLRFHPNHPSQCRGRRGVPPGAATTQLKVGF